MKELYYNLKTEVQNMKGVMSKLTAYFLFLSRYLLSSKLYDDEHRECRRSRDWLTQR